MFWNTVQCFKIILKIGSESFFLKLLDTVPDVSFACVFSQHVLLLPEVEKPKVSRQLFIQSTSSWQSPQTAEKTKAKQLCLRKRVPCSVVCVFLSVVVQQCAVVSIWLKGEDSYVHPAKCVCLFKVHWKANVAVSLPLISDTVWLLHKADIKELLLWYF